jgi:hypothetical protein
MLVFPFIITANRFTTVPLSIPPGAMNLLHQSLSVARSFAWVQWGQPTRLPWAPHPSLGALHSIRLSRNRPMKLNTSQLHQSTRKSCSQDNFWLTLAYLRHFRLLCFAIISQLSGMLLVAALRARQGTLLSIQFEP